MKMRQVAAPIHNRLRRVDQSSYLSYIVLQFEKSEKFYDQVARIGICDAPRPLGCGCEHRGYR